ncbi:uncharacterized protein EV154DRAFT_570097 [Mucor mucedo]|uniref:uncharacterized protein n=1 Tax=Mucor mucedo TaxID=29922 RepID=UPI00221EA739|nr:uncharacterized protein EV154DRAFT_570097 [Mucor mucedo]KAI7873392.1 hypothetical protein EV154DRAFT_570097 [Mucor mucedo]
MLILNMLREILEWVVRDQTKTTLYSNRESRIQDQKLDYNYASNPMNGYVKNGFSIISFLICILIVNTLL